MKGTGEKLREETGKCADEVSDYCICNGNLFQHHVTAYLKVLT
jgi:hypothetical protein